MKKEYLEKLAREVTNDDYLAEVTSVIKPNGKLLGISISKKGSDCNVAPVINGNQIPEDFDDAVAFVNSVIQSTDFTVNLVPADIKKRMYEIRPRVVKSEGNEEIKKMYIGREFLDLYVYYYIPVDVVDIDGFQNVSITYGLAITLGILEDDMFNVALKNLKKDMCKFTLLGRMPVFTNEDLTFGGAQILNTEAFREYEQDLVIIPSSIHELIVMPKESVPEDILKGMIEDVNKSEVLPQEVLSDHPYYYNYAKDCIEM